MKQLMPLCLLLGLNAYAETIRSPIHKIDYGQDGSPHIIKFENGRVAFMSNNNKALALSFSPREIVEAEVDDTSELLSLSSTGKVKQEKRFSLENEPIEFQPTIVPSMAEAAKIYNRLNPYIKRASECSNRAHVWAHEEFKKTGLKSEKAFLLLTRTYINNNRFKWWFHVAPLITVKNGSKLEKVILDFVFMHGPVKLEEWKNSLVFSKRACKIPEGFSEYDTRADQTQDCYYMQRNMYYWMPSDMNNEEFNGIYKTDWSQSEINAAYNEAFFKRL